MDKRALWAAYRNDPKYRDLLIEAGVQGPSDMDRALRSRYCIVPAHDLCNEDEAILLSEYVLSTLVSYEWSMSR